MSAEPRRFAEAIAALGGTAYLIREGERLPFPASVQPRQSGELSSHPLGNGAAADYSLYAAAGGTSKPLAAGDTVEWNGRPYYVMSAEPFTLRGEAVYYKAALRKGAGNE